MAGLGLLFLAVAAATVLCQATAGQWEVACPIAQEPDPGNDLRLRWLIPVPHPCDCTKLYVAGLNSAVVRRPFGVIYHDWPLVTNNATKIRKWLNCTPECVTVTPPSYGYTYLGQEADARRFDFRVMAAKDAHISLSPEPDNSLKNQYEIVIGSYGNTRSEIRSCRYNSECHDANKPTEGILSPKEFRGFWVAFNRSSGEIALGREGQASPFLSHVDPNPRDVTCIGLSGYSGTQVVFKYPC